MADDQSDLVPDNKSTTSPSPSIFDYVEEHGRMYSSFSYEKYPFPIDEPEQDRLDAQNYIWQLTWEGQHALCPKNYNSRRVLDAGTGTGIWAIENADNHPEAEVIGVDLIQPNYVPSNCRFEIDDLEKEWTWKWKFDFIFARNLNGSFKEWADFVRKAYQNLEPGGHLEIQDYDYPLRGAGTEGSGILNWSELTVEAASRRGRAIASPSHIERVVTEAGFEDVTMRWAMVPINTWPSSLRDKQLGASWNNMMRPSLEGISMRLFIRGLGWTTEQTIAFLSEVRRDMGNKSIHGQWAAYCIFGRKPGGTTT